MGPRFQSLCLDGRWTWRLLGSNHRELARGWRTFATREEAVADALAVGRVARTSQMEVSIAADTSWRWVLFADGEPRAASSVHYGRRLECLRAVARFRDCAPVATVAPTPVIRRRQSRSGPPRAQSRSEIADNVFINYEPIDDRDPRPPL